MTPDLGIRRLLQIFAALSVALLLALASVPLRGRFTEWRAAQERYNALAATTGAAKLEPRIQQIWKPELGAADRCTSCHLGMGAAAPLAGDPLFAAHPPLPHDPQALGCTVCHAGQGRATTAAAAHGNVAHWDEPLLPKAHVEAGCATCHSGLVVPRAAVAEKGRALFEQTCKTCHAANGAGAKIGPDLSSVGLAGLPAGWHQHHVDKSIAETTGPWTNFTPLADDEQAQVAEYARTLVGAPRLMAGKALSVERGCRGCHRIGAVGGDDGPDLSDEGRKLVADLDFARVPGERTLPAWLTAHFLDPAKVVPNSGMPNLGLTEAQASLLTTYTLSLRSRAIPESLEPKDRLRVQHLGERDFPTDGAALFGAFCSACHGARGEGGLLGKQRTPAIANPDYLAIADDAFLRHALDDGRAGRRMPAFGPGGAGLKPEELAAVVAHVRSLEPPALTFEAVTAAPADVERGNAVFAANCAGCHGARGEGSVVAPPIAAKDDPVTGDESRLFGTLTVGVAGTAMGSFRRLDAADLHAVIAAVRALPKLDVPRAGWKATPGNAAHGAALFAAQCARCHGDRAQGGEGPQLASRALLAAASDGYLTATIIRGRAGTVMPSFAAEAKDHARLSPADVADVVAFLRGGAKVASR